MECQSALALVLPHLGVCEEARMAQCSRGLLARVYCMHEARLLSDAHFSSAREMLCHARDAHWARDERMRECKVFHVIQQGCRSYSDRNWYAGNPFQEELLPAAHNSVLERACHSLVHCLGNSAYPQWCLLLESCGVGGLQRALIRYLMIELSRFTALLEAPLDSLGTALFLRYPLCFYGENAEGDRRAIDPRSLLGPTRVQSSKSAYAEQYTLLMQHELIRAGAGDRITRVCFRAITNVNGRDRETKRITLDDLQPVFQCDLGGPQNLSVFDCFACWFPMLLAHLSEEDSWWSALSSDSEPEELALGSVQPLEPFVPFPADLHSVICAILLQVDVEIGVLDMHRVGGERKLSPCGEWLANLSKKLKNTSFKRLGDVRIHHLNQLGISRRYRRKYLMRRIHQEIAFRKSLISPSKYQAVRRWICWKADNNFSKLYFYASPQGFPGVIAEIRELHAPARVAHAPTTQLPKLHIDPVLWVLLCGVSDPRSSLYLLRSVRRDVVWRLIYMDHLVQQFYANQVDWDQRSAQRVGYIHFWPEPSNINVNMMPYVIGDKSTLPEYLHEYYKDFVQECPISDEHRGQIGYLTVHESMVTKGASQRRPGLHCEAPGKTTVHNKIIMDASWGGGRNVSECVGGIFMASNVHKSCLIYNCVITDPAAVCGQYGDLEHMRETLETQNPSLPELSRRQHDISYWESQERYKFKTRADSIYWITDRTPHESLPLKEDQIRQFVRWVGPDISVWYAKHSTANPKGIKPPLNVIIVQGDKFS